MLLKSSSQSELWNLFQRTAEKFSSYPAVTSVRGDMSFHDLLSISERLSFAFNESGIGAGSIVHLVLPNSSLFLPAFLALNKLSAIAGLVSSKYRDTEFQALTERAFPFAYLTTPPLASVLERSIPIAGKSTVSVQGLQEDLDLVFPTPGAPAKTASSHGGRSFSSSPEAGLALVKFTSGSTGAPKGVGLTVANLLAETANIVETLQIAPHDRILAPIPVSHSYGFDLGLLPVIFSGANVILRSSFIPREIMGDLSRKDVSIFLGVPSMYRVLLETHLTEVPDLSHIRYLLSCTAPLAPDLIMGFSNKFKKAICQHYGSSETGAISNHIPAKVLERPGSVGIAVKNVDLRIIDDNRRELANGEEGEVLVRSKAVAVGYVTGEIAGNAGYFGQRDNDIGEYRTGDLGVIDEEGFLFWRGRKDHIINVGGLKVYPNEITQVLESCPTVAKAYVFGVRDQSGEEFVHAVVTLSQSTREQDILAFCRKRLADYKVPRRIDIKDSIPTGASVKTRDPSGDIYL